MSRKIPKKPSIAFVVVYFGKWPVWFPAFLRSCESNPTITWIIFTDCKLPPHYPSNVQFHQLTMRSFNSLATKKLGFRIAIRKPYKMCEFKPLYGFIFKRYLSKFDYWGHCDIDIVWGNIRKFMTDRVLGKYDIISSRKSQISGHFNLYRNNRTLCHLFKRHPQYKEYLLQPEYCWFDEKAMSLVVSVLHRKRELRVYWPKYLFNFSVQKSEGPSVLGKITNGWVWKEGKLLDLTDGNPGKEVMYLHFMTWKNSLKQCEFGYRDPRPKQFFVSYSEISLEPKDP